MAESQRAELRLVRRGPWLPEGASPPTQLSINNQIALQVQQLTHSPRSRTGVWDDTRQHALFKQLQMSCPRGEDAVWTLPRPRDCGVPAADSVAFLGADGTDGRELRCCSRAGALTILRQI